MKAGDRSVDDLVDESQWFSARSAEDRQDLLSCTS